MNHISKCILQNVEKKKYSRGIFTTNTVFTDFHAKSSIHCNRCFLHPVTSEQYIESQSNNHYESIAEAIHVLNQP